MDIVVPEPVTEDTPLPTNLMSVNPVPTLVVPD